MKSIKAKESTRLESIKVKEPTRVSLAYIGREDDLIKKIQEWSQQDSNKHALVVRTT